MTTFTQKSKPKLTRVIETEIEKCSYVNSQIILLLSIAGNCITHAFYLLAEFTKNKNIAAHEVKNGIQKSQVTIYVGQHSSVSNRQHCKTICMIFILRGRDSDVLIRIIPFS